MKRGVLSIKTVLLRNLQFMFDLLDKYKTNGHFFFRPTDSLEEVCNAPDNKNGVYVVYQLKDGHVDMVYIGASGTREILIVKEVHS